MLTALCHSIHLVDACMPCSNQCCCICRAEKLHWHFFR